MIKITGLAYAARKTTVGIDHTIEAIRQQEVKLVLLANDASNNTKKTILDKAKFYQVEVIDDLTSREISHAIGKENVKVIGITDRGFCQLLIQKKGK